MEKPSNPILMAVIGAAHGIRGEVRVKSFTADPAALGDYGPLFDAAGRRFDIAEARPQKGALVVRFEAVRDRNAAEALAGVELFVDRSALPAIDGDDEFYHADLIGLRVEDETGGAIGTVKAVFDHGGGDMLEIATAGTRTVLAPFTRAAVPHVDIAAGRITLDRLAAGLVDAPDQEPLLGDAMVGEPMDEGQSPTSPGPAPRPQRRADPSRRKGRPGGARR